MAQNDRTTGLVGYTGMKIPARVATTAAIVLSGEQTIDGVACVTGDRVLVKDQASSIDNGVYEVDTGDWSRAKDFSGTYDIVSGSMVRVNEGSTNAGGIFAITSADDMTIGESAITFGRITINFVVRESFTSAAGQTVFNTGTAYQVGSNGITVFVNGLLVTDYTETNTNRITFNTGLALNDHVIVLIGRAQGNLTAAAASLVAITDAGDYFIAVTVEAALQELVDAITVDNGDASAVLTWGVNTPIQRWNTPLTANRTATLSAAKEGSHFTCVRGAGATGTSTLDVAGICTLRVPGEWCTVRYDAGTAAWILESYGLLPSAEVRMMSADVGDASVNVTTGSTGRTVRFATPITAERSATLQAAGAYSSSRFRVVRERTATGNYPVIVTDGVTEFARLVPAQTCEVEHSGSAWKVISVTDHFVPNSNLIHLYDDFLGEEVDGFRWQSLIGTDAACRQAMVLPDQLGGVARLVTGANAGATMALNGAHMHSQLNWKANKSALSFEVRVMLDAITNVALFIGFTDQRAALEMPFTLAAGDVLTSNATDAVGVLFDTAADTDNWWLVGVKADVDAAKQNTAVAPVAATFETWRVDVDLNGQATFYRNGVAIGAAMASALTTNTLLTPVIATFARGAVSRNIDFDHVLVRMQR